MSNNAMPATRETRAPAGRRLAARCEGQRSGMRTIIASALLTGTALMAQAQPPQLLQVVREPIHVGGEAAYEAIESEIAAACVALKCPHPHLALETSVGPKEIWWFNFFESEAQRLQVTRAYEGNRPLMEVLTRNGERKSKYTGTITNAILRYRPDMSSNANWVIHGARFFIVNSVAAAIDTQGSVFEAPDGSYLVVQPVRTRKDAERVARNDGATVLEIRPSWGLPAKEWIDADATFWSVNPAVSQPKRTQQ